MKTRTKITGRKPLMGKVVEKYSAGGSTIESVANHFGVSKSYVRNCLKSAREDERIDFYSRNLSAHEANCIIGESYGGKSAREIASQIGRSTSSVYKVLRGYGERASGKPGLDNINAGSVLKIASGEGTIRDGSRGYRTLGAAGANDPTAFPDSAARAERRKGAPLVETIKWVRDTWEVGGDDGAIKLLREYTDNATGELNRERLTNYANATFLRVEKPAPSSELESKLIAEPIVSREADEEIHGMVEQAMNANLGGEQPKKRESVVIRAAKASQRAIYATKKWYEHNVVTGTALAVLGVAAISGGVLINYLANRMEDVERTPIVLKRMSDVKTYEGVQKKVNEQGKKIGDLGTRVDNGFNDLKSSIKEQGNNIDALGRKIKDYAGAVAKYQEKESARLSALENQPAKEPSKQPEPKPISQPEPKPEPKKDVPIIPEFPNPQSVPVSLEAKVNLTGLRSEFDTLVTKIGSGAGSVEAAVYRDMINAAETDFRKKKLLLVANKYLGLSVKEAAANAAIAGEFGGRQ